MLIHDRRGMTLLELLVVIAIIGVLVALLLPAVQSARASARSASCKNSSRQIGLAVLQHCDSHDGDFPRWSHGDESREQGKKQSWVYTLAPFLENVDEIRLCPEDPHLQQRQQARGTSYVINDHLAAEGVPNGVRNINKLLSTSRTIAIFEGANSRGSQDEDWGNPKFDHAHASQWFSQLNRDWGLTDSAVRADIQPDRHFDSAHYLYVDGHVGTIADATIAEWIDEGKNFGRPE